MNKEEIEILMQLKNKMDTSQRLIDFVKESNRIEGITREPKDREIVEAERFLGLETVTQTELLNFVKVYEPEAKLRNKEGLDVRIGNHQPIKGGLQILIELNKVLSYANNITSETSEYDIISIHFEYEDLHPFTDCNGRSGRMLWLWQMNKLHGKLPSLGFLHTFYYQTLNNKRGSFND